MLNLIWTTLVVQFQNENTHTMRTHELTRNENIDLWTFPNELTRMRTIADENIHAFPRMGTLTF